MLENPVSNQNGEDSNTMSAVCDEPLISIGMPIWNCSSTVLASVNSILNQSYMNWELFISDNYSNDGTFELVQNLVQGDPRITLVKQTENKGGWQNFLFVFNSSKREYFKFHAGDDCLSTDYLESIINGLKENPNLIGICTPDKWDTQNDSSEKGNTFDFPGPQEVRLGKFKKYCWKSNGVFYGVFKRDALNRAITPDLFRSKIHILDWLIVAKILKEGEIKRTSSGMLTLGSNGASNSNPFTWFNQLNGILNKVLPYRGFTKLYSAGEVPVSWRTRLGVFLWVSELNINHFKGLTRLGIHKAGIRGFSK